MTYYPIFLKVENRNCLLVGAGAVGVRKLKSILECGPAQVTVLDTAQPSPEMLEISRDPRVKFEQRPFRDNDLDAVFIAFACTSNTGLNRRITDLCAEKNILCNIADFPEGSNFIVPSVIRQGDLTLAVSSGGCTPAFTKKIRRELQDIFGPHYAAFITLMGRIRPLVLDLGKETSHNTALFRQLVGSPILDELEAGNMDRVKEILTSTLPQELVPRIPELIDELI
ncbi:bifunctional precorrin-2 dehydrogenase/sirohydrochlorin ferrochelatase [Desulfovibrio sp. JC010]|uniref:precorrin-2 dehydrogenase/sirohydrochlorin ferrochelatase family protein n=1 Tax=Desulfovibrio sp. JC010 TaxID=2593641 RepID=UPI0013D1BA7E|nr:bifunctional precorrin-2 dehydrogenase/sirohydrochlorin ferrochelatase [Desulfovibrio sp. JC010]NDV27972.1 bifunctional precorrin-2 dehydrogenase/sirohydrochlorin ferrochelatase [Desulfovibrio sp. JC010]